MQCIVQTSRWYRCLSICYFIATTLLCNIHNYALKKVAGAVIRLISVINYRGAQHSGRSRQSKRTAFNGLFVCLLFFVCFVVVCLFSFFSFLRRYSIGRNVIEFVIDRQLRYRCRIRNRFERMCVCLRIGPFRYRSSLLSVDSCIFDS